MPQVLSAGMESTFGYILLLGVIGVGGYAGYKIWKKKKSTP